ncbi:MAG: A/G-specific adenine glycosylase [Lachnospiraceae bacterium]|nr:A/G-specific adenine glycosylase [Lachnospiraceae bacterium]
MKRNLGILKEELNNAPIKRISKPLLIWYDHNKRILPWRENPTPYGIWISEIMLQQTRVEAVKPYYERFMHALPDIAALANVPEEDLLKLWEGLGYYNRARNLKKAAQLIVAQYGGRMPADHEALLALPGIGSYTGGAIASIAFGVRKPAVDGNVLRVLSRLRADDRNVSDAKVRKAVEEELEDAMPKDRPGDFNQALMEIGACVCMPNGAPRCDACPLAKECLAHAEGKELAYPIKEAKKARTSEDKTVLLIRDTGRVALTKRPSKGLLAGMYEFPCLSGHIDAQEVVRYLSEHGLKVLRILPMGDAKHVFTHKEWHMIGYEVRVDELASAIPDEETGKWIYVDPKETRDKYPIPSAYEVYAAKLSMIRGKKRFLEED